MQFYLRDELRVPAAVGALSFVTGVGVGYLICSRRVKVTTTEIEETLVIDIERGVESKAQLALDFARAAEEQISRPSTPYVLSTKLVGNELEVKTSAVGEPHDPEPEPFRPIKSEYFQTLEDPESELEAFEDDWNQGEEELDRGPDAPYVIHKEEFHAGETNYQQSCLEYFAADNVLCDEARVPIYAPEKIVGRLEFGRGSGDSDVVYIRNESLKAEYEITRNEGSYQVEVLGIEAEEEFEEGDLKHSMPKFRMGGPDAD